MNPKMAAVLADIENLDNHWTCELTNEQVKEHSFGRIRNLEEKVVKLWSVPRTTGQLLKFFVIATGAKTILELGCSAGYSTLWITQGAMVTGGHVYTTEILPEKIAIAEKHFKTADVKKYITLYQQDIMQTLSHWQHGPIDLLFMDADIQRYPDYLEKVEPLLNEKAMIIVDNALTHESYMQAFFDKVKALNKFIMEILPVDHGIALLTPCSSFSAAD